MVEIKNKIINFIVEWGTKIYKYIESELVKACICIGTVFETFEIFPELFLSTCIIYIFFHGTFVCLNSQFNYTNIINIFNFFNFC